MLKRLLTAALAALMLLTLAPMALAATEKEIQEDNVFLKQQGRGTCTLAATAMMLRRTALLNGDENWNQITEASCRAVFWRGGLPYEFRYGNITIGHKWLPGGTANRQFLMDMLEKHPEGVVLHARGVPHGVLLTDYTDGVFYCADSAVNKPLGRIPITEAYGTRIENSSAIWYVTSPVKGPETSVADLLEAVADPDDQEHPLARLANLDLAIRDN